MSREFGTCTPGYFHSKINDAIDDLTAAQHPSTRIWAPFFREFYPVAYAICTAEAGDSGESCTIRETIAQIDKLEAALKEVRKYIAPIKEVADDAVREAVEKALEKSSPRYPEPQTRSFVEIWREGYMTSGESSRAQLLRIVYGVTSLQDACARHADEDPEFKRLYNPMKMTYWGCRLYDNEADARKKFG